MKLPLSHPLDRKILKTTAERLALLAEIDIHTVGDFLEYFPRTYEDFSTPTELSDLRADQKNVLKGKFIRVWHETVRGNMRLTKALFCDERSGGKVECVWFSNPTLEKRLPIDTSVLISAKARIAYGKISLQSPEFEYASRNIYLGRIAPIYREHGKIKAAWMREKIHDLLQKSADFADVLPPNIIATEKLLPKNKAVRELHFPTEKALLKRAQKTLAFEELFVLQMKALMKKEEWQKSAKQKTAIPLNAELIKKFFSGLPFVPTNSQKIAIFEILRDLEKTVPMMRLLEGDVGSGKTVVAMAAAIAVQSTGQQVAFLAPTEILAKQHFLGIEKIFSTFDTNIRVEILTGSTKEADRKHLLATLKNGDIDILIGTHALLEERVVFQNLGLLVIDEQHRFGVQQRERLIQKGSPHVLQMTATPIPRTLALVAFGDQDLSVLTELPPNRKPVHTMVVPPEERKQIEAFIDLEIEKGRQVFVVCPLIAESENLEVKSVTEEFSRLETIFPHRRIGLLHGKMKAAEKDHIMAYFVSKKFDILVSTAVIEVGVDIPNATVMMIEGAERFGLAQLHQFRGRVGRGKEASSCFLFSSTGKKNDRLRAMEKEDCGFHLAEIDMQLRGAGQLYGLRQSGVPDLRMADFSDGRLVVSARKRAEEFLAQEKWDHFPILKKIVSQESNQE